MSGRYTALLGHGLGMIPETRTLLDIWTEGMSSSALMQEALQSGRFPHMSARRLLNFVKDCFTPRYLRDQTKPARLLRTMETVLAARELEQLMFIYTCRANPILADFVRDVYWDAYSAGRTVLSNDDAKAFVTRANQDGKTIAPWSASTIRRVAGYLTGCCSDFGLLERGKRSTRKILPYRVEPNVAALLAYDLHFSGQGDNQVLGAQEWTWFGMDAADVLDELKRLSLKGFFIVQHAGGVTHISWSYKSMEEVASGIA